MSGSSQIDQTTSSISSLLTNFTKDPFLEKKR